MCIAVFKAVVLLKARIHDKTVGDYSPIFYHVHILSIYSTATKLFKAVVLLKARIHDKSVGGYSPIFYHVHIFVHL